MPSRHSMTNNDDSSHSVPPVGMWFQYSSVNDFMHEWMGTQTGELAGGHHAGSIFGMELNWPDTCCERGPAHRPYEPKISMEKIPDSKRNFE